MTPHDASDRRVPQPLRRDRDAPAVRMVHLGLGNFFRAHQAWYTAHAAPDWGIAAFTGRRPQAARVLAPQGGLYTLITRGPERDELEVVPSLAAVHAAEEHDSWLDYFRDPALSVVTLTVTEAGYLRRPDGSLDLERAADDVAALREDPGSPVTTAPGKVVAGLLARQGAGAGPLTLLPCDNLPENGPAVARVVRELAAEVEPDLLPWLEEHLDVASSMVDRITPAAGDAERELVERELGLRDETPVVTEPFAEWVISGEFPAGRPEWERAGARIVADVGPYEQRKLLLLNGAHSLMAYAGSVLGHRTVDEAFADERVRGWVERLWDEAARILPFDAEELRWYRAALSERFANPRMGDELARIAMDGSQKLPVRHLPVLRHARAAGRLPEGGTVALAAWIAHLRGSGAPVRDVEAERLRPLAAGQPEDAVTAVLGVLAPDLAADAELRDVVAGWLRALEGDGGVVLPDRTVR